MKIYQKRSQVFLYIIGCLVFVALGFLLLHISNDNSWLSETVRIVAAWASIIFFGIFGVPICIMQFIKPKLMFEILEDGFYSEKWGYVKWNNIKEISLHDIVNSKIIMFNMKTVSGKHKFVQNSNKSITGYNFDVALSGTGVDIEEVYKLMLKHVQDAEAENNDEEDIKDNNEQVIKLSKATQIMFELVNFFTPLVFAIIITGHYMKENNLRPIFYAFVIAVFFSIVFVMTSIKKIREVITKKNDSLKISNLETQNIIKAEEIKNIEVRGFPGLVVFYLNNGNKLWSLNYSVNAIALLLLLVTKPIVSIPFFVQRYLLTKHINDVLKYNVIFNLDTILFKIINIFCWLSCVYITFWGIYSLIVNYTIISGGWLFK